MIDWFVVFTPFVLIPVFLMFAFVGCPLDREGRGPSIGARFDYDEGLTVAAATEPALESIEWQYNVDLKVDPSFNTGTIGGPGLTTAGPFARGGNSGIAIKTQGDSISHPFPIDSYGEISCTCWVVTKANTSADYSAEYIELKSGPKSKIEDEIGPTFRLSREGSGFKFT